MSHRLFVFTGTLLAFCWKNFGLDFLLILQIPYCAAGICHPVQTILQRIAIVYGLLGYDIGTSNGTIRMNQWTLSRFLGCDS